MKNLIPPFIQQKYLAGKRKGRFSAYTMFVDLSGFTPLTEELMLRGKEGAEQLSHILNNIFAPLVELVYEQGGIIPYFAGDAFTAIFREKEEVITVERFLKTAQQIRQFFQKQGFIFEDFPIGIKIGLSHGEVKWGIVGEENLAFYFRGSAIHQAAESQINAKTQEIILDKSLYKLLPATAPVSPSRHAHFYLLMPIDLPEMSSLLRQYFPLENSEINNPISAIEERTARQFLPESVIDYNQEGEFREVVSVFISFEGIKSHKRLNQFATVVLDEMHNFSGYFKEIDFGDKGGVIFGFFGAPVSFENNIDRALEFILSIENKLQSLQKKTDLRFRIGITTGTAFTGIVGGEERCQYAAVGNLVNLAARLMTYANWGEVSVDKEIQKNRHFRFKHKGDILYKGIKGNVPTYIFQGRNAENSPSFTGILIGRKTELKRLTQFAQPILDTPHGRIIEVYGEAGIGKSRLAFELRKALKNEGEITWLTAQTDQILRKPFNAFIFLLKHYFEQSPDNSIPQNWKNFAKNMSWLYNELQSTAHPRRKELKKELQRTASILSTLVGLPSENSLWEQLDAKGRYRNSIQAIINLIIVESIIAPLVLNLEDAQWFDNGSKELLTELAKKISPYPIIILITSRYYDDGSKFELLTTEAIEKYGILHHQVNLKTLHPTALKLFAEDKLANEISEELHELLVRSTNGNPFYLEQILEYFNETNLLQLSDNQWTIKDSSLKMSGSINAILTARIDRLSNLVRETVKAAAVIGREFDIPVLQEVIRQQEDFCKDEDDIALLLNKQVKTAEKGQIWRAVNELRYMFKHSLLREAAYSMQLRTRLQELHHLIARAIEKLYANKLEERYLDLAFHYEQAEVNHKTREYLLKAANHARQNYQNKLALEYYDKLLKHINHKKDIDLQIEVLVGKGNVLELIGEWEDCEKIFRKALELAEKINDNHFVGRLQNHLGHLLLLKGDYIESRQHLEVAINHFADTDQFAELSKTYGDLGMINFRKGRYEEAKSFFKKSLELGERAADFSNHPRIVANLGLAHMNQGNYDKGIARQQLELDRCRAENDKSGMATLFVNMGIVYFEKGDYDNALNCQEQGFELSEELGNKQLIAIALGCIGSIYERKGDYSKAMELFEKDLELCEQLGDKQGTAITLGLIGELWNYLGEFDRAVAYLQKNLMISRELNYRKGTAKALNTLGDVYYYLQHFDRSVKFYNEAIELSRAIGQHLVLGMSLVEKGKALLKMKNYVAAEHANDEALEFAEELGNPDLIFEAKILQARIAFHTKSPEFAHELFEQLIDRQLPESKNARIYYHLSVLFQDLAYRDRALKIYKELYQATPKFAIKRRIQIMQRM
ncbi:MAG: tetratricopeptide repeat protein [Saprospiraceae bacterium]